MHGTAFQIYDAGKATIEKKDTGINAYICLNEGKIYLYSPSGEDVA